MSDAPDELERLKLDIAVYVEISAQQATEIEQLRAALSWYAKAIYSDDGYRARKALNDE